MLLLPVLAHGSEYEAYSKDLIKPYGQYKKTLSLTGKKDDIQKAKEMLVQFQESWKKFAALYADDAPVALKFISDYRERINRPLQVAVKAMSFLEAGDYAKAHSVLEEIRYILWDMRIRSGILSLNDRINDFHEAMEIILDKAAAAKSPEELNKVGERYGMWLAIKWEEVGLSKDFGSEEKTFQSALRDGREAVKHLNEALSKGDKDMVKKAGGAVKDNYKKIFFLPL
jgi:hypothetical protein